MRLLNECGCREFAVYHLCKESLPRPIDVRELPPMVSRSFLVSGRWEVSL